MLLEESRWVLRNPAASLRVSSRLDTYGLGVNWAVCRYGLLVDKYAFPGAGPNSNSH